MACVQNCISKMHVQNCIKGASLEAMEAPIESNYCVHLHLSSKKKNTGTQLYLCDEYGNSLQKNNFLVGHEISFVFIVTTAEISNVDSNSRIQ